MEPCGVPPAGPSEARAGGMTHGGIRCTVWFGAAKVPSMRRAQCRNAVQSGYRLPRGASEAGLSTRARRHPKVVTTYSSADATAVPACDETTRPALGPNEIHFSSGTPGGRDSPTGVAAMEMQATAIAVETMRNVFFVFMDYVRERKARSLPNAEVSHGAMWRDSWQTSEASAGSVTYGGVGCTVWFGDQGSCRRMM